MLYDVSDGELVGVLEVRAGKVGVAAMSKPDLPAGLGGPSRLLLIPREGDHSNTRGTLIFQISVDGPPPKMTGIPPVDQDGNGVPDDVGEGVVPASPYIPAETFDDFLAGYNEALYGS